MDDRTERDPPVRRLAKGDKVLAPAMSRHLPIAEVLEVYENADGHQVLVVRYVKYPETTYFYPAQDLDYVGEKKFLVAGTQIYRVSDGRVVAESENWAQLIADFLETSFPGEADTQSPVTHDEWSALNK
jgi:hypothetical protein